MLSPFGALPLCLALAFWCWGGPWAWLVPPLLSLGGPWAWACFPRFWPLSLLLSTAGRGGLQVPSRLCLLSWVGVGLLVFGLWGPVGGRPAPPCGDLCPPTPACVCWWVVPSWVWGSLLVVRPRCCLLSLTPLFFSLVGCCSWFCWFLLLVVGFRGGSCTPLCGRSRPPRVLWVSLGGALLEVADEGTCGLLTGDAN